jgi:hypothetical protein
MCPTSMAPALLYTGIAGASNPVSLSLHSTCPVPADAVATLSDLEAIEGNLWRLQSPKDQRYKRSRNYRALRAAASMSVRAISLPGGEPRSPVGCKEGSLMKGA